MKGQYFHQGTAVDVGRKQPLQVSEARHMAVRSTLHWIERQVATRNQTHDAPTVFVTNTSSVDEPFTPANIDKGRKLTPLVYLRGLSPRHFMGGEWNMGGGCQDMTVSQSLIP